jgi:signal transduction histidine kinase
MEPIPSPQPRSRWSGPLSPFSLAVYLVWIGIAFQPWSDWRRGHLQWSAATLLGLAGMCAVPLLYIILTASSDPGTDQRSRLRLRVLALLQLPAALVACWALGSGSMPVLLIVVAGVLGALYPLRTVIALMVLADAAVVLMLQQRWGWGDALASTLSYGAFQIFSGLVTAYARTAEEARDAALRINSELLATRRLLLESVRGEERLRLSRELHDVVGHKLTALKLQLRLQARQDATPALAECERLADELLADVRGVVDALRQHDGVDLQQALAALVPALPQPRVSLELEPQVRAPGVAQAQALLRSAQEGLTNALRHSGAAQVVIRLRQEGAGLALSVEDDGRARELPQHGNGLRGMRERLEALGGTLELRLRDGGGLRLRVWLPQPEVAA